MKMVIKGDFKDLSQYKLIQEVYTYIPSCLDRLHKEEFIDNKRELEFTGNSLLLLRHTLKLIENKNTETLTVIIK